MNENEVGLKSMIFDLSASDMLMTGLSQVS
jgi:hypothetical protein